MTRTGLIELLDRYQIPWQTWGQGEAKTVEHLLRELDEDEVELIPVGDQLHRRVRGVITHVYYEHGDGRRLRLIEDRQVFADGRIRRRWKYGTPGEKLKKGETPESAAKRVFTEELGIPVPPRLSPELSTEKEPLLSDSFPGLWSHFFTTVYSVSLPKEFYFPDGYVEHQPDKTSYFVWR